MNLRQIRAFLLVAQHKSFTRAAEEFGVTQSAVSLMIREFEASIGMPVLARSTRSIYLTPVGEILQAELTRIIEDLDKVFTDITKSIRIRNGNVKVASLSTIAARLLPSAIAHCKRQHPGITISIRDDTSAQVLDLIKKGVADFGISTNDEPSSELEFFPLFSEKFSVVCNREHQFAKLKSVKWNDLCKVPFIAMTNETGIGRRIDEVDAKQTKHLMINLRVTQLSTVLGQIEGNLGVSLLPEIANPSPRHHALVAIPLSDLKITRAIGVIRRSDRPFSPAASGVIDAVIATVKADFKSPSRPSRPEAAILANSKNG